MQGVYQGDIRGILTDRIAAAVTLEFIVRTSELHVTSFTMSITATSTAFIPVNMRLSRLSVCACGQLCLQVQFCDALGGFAAVTVTERSRRG